MQRTTAQQENEAVPIQQHQLCDVPVKYLNVKSHCFFPWLDIVKHTDLS